MAFYRKEDEQTFEKLFEQYYNSVYVYICRRINNVHDAEDLTSDVFLKAYSNPYNSSLAKFSTYIFTIAANTIKNYYRDSSKKRSFLESDEPDEHLSDDLDIIGDLLKKEECSKLLKALTVLPDKQYNVLYRRYYLNMSFKEIAVDLGITENYASKIHNRALEKLKSFLE